MTAREAAYLFQALSENNSDLVVYVRRYSLDAATAGQPTMIFIMLARPRCFSNRRACNFRVMDGVCAHRIAGLAGRGQTVSVKTSKSCEEGIDR